ncbi:hypothetical protein V2G26_010135 [Clonostachys chloroleuca]
MPRRAEEREPLDQERPRPWNFFLLLFQCLFIRLCSARRTGPSCGLSCAGAAAGELAVVPLEQPLTDAGPADGALEPGGALLAPRAKPRNLLTTLPDALRRSSASVSSPTLSSGHLAFSRRRHEFS